MYIPVERYLRIEFVDVLFRLSHHKPVKKKPIEAETNAMEMSSISKQELRDQT